MIFAHFADAHIGSWRDRKLSDINLACFMNAIDLCIERKVDFVLIAGDLFNTSLPAIDKLKLIVKKIRELKRKGIPLYIVPGSHDFSPSGKTMLDVLENAGLLVNVVKGSISDNKLKLRFTVDEKTGAKITGMLGKRGSLEKIYYDALDKESLEKENGFKIFVLHSAIDELKPEDLGAMDSSPLSYLPKGFDYYAGGHLHEKIEKHMADYGQMAYPGALFANNFAELEKDFGGGVYIYDDTKNRNDDKNDKLEYVNVNPHNILSLKIDCNLKDASEIKNVMHEQIRNKEIKDKIITLRFFGRLKGGKIGDIDYKSIFEMLYEKGAYVVLKNSSKVITPEFEEIMMHKENSYDIEKDIIKEHVGKIKFDFDGINEEEYINQLMKALDDEKQEGERVADFEERVMKNVDNKMRK